MEPRPDKARPLADDGIAVADKAEDAVAGAAVVVTMLFDAASVAAVMTDALPAMAEGAVWAQTSTVGIDGTAELAALAGAHGVGFVDAPVMGTRQPAEEGKLTVLAAGPTELRAAVAPVFDAISAKTVWVGEEPGAGHRLKLVANAWVLSVVAGTAQSIALAEGLGLDPQVFLDTIAGGAMDAPYVQLKGRAMIAGDYSAAFAVDGALKDSGLDRRRPARDRRRRPADHGGQRPVRRRRRRGPRGRGHGRGGGGLPPLTNGRVADLDTAKCASRRHENGDSPS